MTQAQVIEKLQHIFDDVFVAPVTVTPELSANDVDEWDSLTHISLMVAVEKAFNVRFRVGEVEATENLGQLATLIANRLNGN